MTTCFMLNEGVRLTLIESDRSDNIAMVRLPAHGRTFVFYTPIPPAREEPSY